MTDRNLAALLADLLRQRRDLEKNLDDTDRSRKSTQNLIDRIVELKVRAAKLANDHPPPNAAKLPNDPTPPKK